MCVLWVRIDYGECGALSSKSVLMVKVTEANVHAGTCVGNSVGMRERVVCVCVCVQYTR